jgi:membrane-associated phospholipid phosphatase
MLSHESAVSSGAALASHPGRTEEDGNMLNIAQLDTSVLEWFRRQRSPQLTRAMRTVTWLGSAEVLTPLASAVTVGLWARRSQRAALFVGLSAIGSSLMNQGLKSLFGRARPNLALRLSSAGGFAFPSGHSMASAAIYGGLAMVVRAHCAKLRVAAAAVSSLCVLGVGVSRAYLHVHYPSDVAIGWALGFAWSLSLRGLLSQ